MTFDLEQKLELLLSGLPEELRNNVEKKVRFYESKRPAFTDEEIYQEAKDLVKLELLAYTDRRVFLGLFNRKFVIEKAGEFIRSIVESDSIEEKDIYSLARVDFDMNGLKVLNDLGGSHGVGNEGLRLFSEVIKKGETTSWLRNMGFVVIPSVEGGDEFGLLLYGKEDLRPYVTDIVNGYFEETRNINVSDLIDFSGKEVRDKLKFLGIDKDIPSDFKFEITTSVGIALFGEALNLVDVNEEGKSYKEISRTILNKMFELAHDRSSDHKSWYKSQLGKTNPGLSALYARMSREVIHLEKKIKELEERLREK